MWTICDLETHVNNGMWAYSFRSDIGNGTGRCTNLGTGSMRPATEPRPTYAEIAEDIACKVKNSVNYNGTIYSCPRVCSGIVDQHLNTLRFYDADKSGDISKPEAVNAVNDYFEFKIEKAQATAVNEAYNYGCRFSTGVGATPTPEPTTVPTVIPTVYPTIQPTVYPTTVPTIQPTVYPTSQPTVYPTSQPTVYPTVTPTSTPGTGTTINYAMVVGIIIVLVLGYILLKKKK